MPLPLELYTSSNFIGLFVEEGSAEVLKKFAADFAAEAASKTGEPGWPGGAPQSGRVGGAVTNGLGSGGAAGLEHTPPGSSRLCAVLLTSLRGCPVQLPDTKNSHLLPMEPPQSWEPSFRPPPLPGRHHLGRSLRPRGAQHRGQRGTFQNPGTVMSTEPCPRPRKPVHSP